MIQRIQSVWLLLASLFLALMFVFPLVEVSLFGGGMQWEMRAGQVNKMFLSQEVEHYSFWWINVAIAVASLFPLVILFLFKDRKLQKSLCYVAILVVLILCFILMKSISHLFKEVDLSVNNFKIVGIAPSLAIVLLLLAIRGINKDENLVRAADRLR